MYKTIEPTAVNGTIKAPASKSVVQRALAAALLGEGETTISGYSESEDALAALNIVETLGAGICLDEDLKIIGNPPSFRQSQLCLNCGESGLSSRLFAPLALLYSPDIVITGRGSLLNRPFGNLMKPAFEQMGIKYSDNHGKLPVNLHGTISANKISIDGGGGSQFLSGILMTLPLLARDSLVEVRNLKSKPYIDLTLNVMQKFGIEIANENHEFFRIKSGQKYGAGNFKIEGDWSGASCLLVAGATAGKIEVTNLDYNTTQADVKIIEALLSAGAKVNINASSVTVSRDKLQSFEFDANDSPDLFPALVALAVNCSGVSRIKGVGRLATKESNRAETLKSEYAKTGVNILFDNDCMIIAGQTVKGATIDSHNDHRIAMSLAVAALNAESPITVENADCVKKSYPEFWSEMLKIK